ncbi:MAG: hypothetical protein ACE5KX_03625 [Acidimicrobiia bacterium]
MDIGVNLIESYLRLNGYLTLSEFEVQRRAEEGSYESITDVDIVALRLPGELYVADPDAEGCTECELLLIQDPLLALEEDCADVIIGEVKQAEAEFNPAITDHQVLHSVLRRMEWLYDEPLLDVVKALQLTGSHYSPGRGGGRVRTRLVAFGRSKVNDLNTISHTHIVETLLRFFSDFEEAFRPIQFRDPAPAMLRLLLKSGFEVHK